MITPSGRQAEGHNSPGGASQILTGAPECAGTFHTDSLLAWAM
jgi:hypothetical protein